MQSPVDWFEDYVVDAVLGHGGHATVYRAHGVLEPDRVVALKVLDDYHCQPVQMARLQREFAFANRLDHPHIIKVYRHGSGWLAMELIDGGTVAKLQAMTDRLTALKQVADALDYAHRHGIVHCDVKPSNILVSLPFSERGTVLIDFGVAHSVAGGVAQARTRRGLVALFGVRAVAGVRTVRGHRRVRISVHGIRIDHRLTTFHRHHVDRSGGRAATRPAAKGLAQNRLAATRVRLDHGQGLGEEP